MKRALYVLACYAIAFARLAAQPANGPTGGAVTKNASTGNLTAGFGTGNNTVTISSGGNLTATAGSTATFNGTFSGTPTGGTLDLSAIGELTLSATLNRVPENKPFYFSSTSGNAPWRIYSSTLASPETDDQVLFITSNAKYDPVTGWSAFDVPALGASSFQFENYYDGAWEWNLDFANPGGSFVDDRALAFMRDWATGKNTWKFSTGDNAWRFQLTDTLASISAPLQVSGLTTITSEGAGAGVIQGGVSGGLTVAGRSDDQAQPIIFKLGSVEVGRFEGTTGSLSVSRTSGNPLLELEISAAGGASDFPLVQFVDGRASGRNYNIENGRTAGVLAIRDSSAGADRLTVNASGDIAVSSTTAATTGGAGAVKVSGGIYAAGAIVTGSSVTTAGDVAVVKTSGNPTLGLTNGSGGSFPLIQLSDVRTSGLVWNIENGRTLGSLTIRKSSTSPNQVLELTSVGDAIFGSSTEATTSGVGSITTVGGIYATKAIVTSTHLEGVEQASSPAAPSANGWRIYAKDNGAGKTVLYVRFASGAEQQIAIEP